MNMNKRVNIKQYNKELRLQPGFLKICPQNQQKDIHSNFFPHQFEKPLLSEVIAAIPPPLQECLLELIKVYPCNLNGIMGASISEIAIIARDCNVLLIIGYN